MAENQDLLYAVEGGVARLTINREAQRNAISLQAVQLFLEALDRAERDEQVRAVLVTGSGDRAFCAGADLGGGMAGSGQEGGNAFRDYARLLHRLSGFPKPTVARVNGACVAGGTGFMLACDIVIARDDAKFGTPEVNVGLWPMMIGALIFRNCLRKKAMEMILLGERLTAAQAEEMGLITRAVPAAELDGAVERVLEKLTGNSPIGMRIGKEAFERMEGMPLAEALEFLADRLVEVASTQDAAEGIAAFIEKRKPVFQGR